MTDIKGTTTWLNTRISSSKTLIRGNIQTIHEELEALERKLLSDDVLTLQTMSSTARTLSEAASRIKEHAIAIALRLEVLEALGNEPVAAPATPAQPAAYDNGKRMAAADVEVGDIIWFCGSECFVTTIEKIPNRPVLRFYLTFTSNGKPIASKYTSTSPHKLWSVRKKVQA